MKKTLARGEALRQRNPLRLRGYDYAHPATYFVTTNTHDQVCWFGRVVDGLMRLSDLGQIVQQEWITIPDRRAAVELDAFVVMPNHVHGIVRILANAKGEAILAPTRRSGGASPGSLGAIVGSFKAGVTRRIAAIKNLRGLPLWQSGYHDHILRTDGELDRIRRYIAENPENWPFDPENPRRTTGARQASPPQEQGPLHP